ncbi:hypothetical protein AKO1_012052 [Acrasis kona]|uniref:MATH domain-containing protein n=1 Tax=Acrasis kona TaxID=1008807 RepID=A0AAW2Z9G3_9EUKA
MTEDLQSQIDNLKNVMGNRSVVKDGGDASALDRLYVDQEIKRITNMSNHKSEEIQSKFNSLQSHLQQMERANESLQDSNQDKMNQLESKLDLQSNQIMSQLPIEIDKVLAEHSKLKVGRLRGLSISSPNVASNNTSLSFDSNEISELSNAIESQQTLISSIRKETHTVRSDLSAIKLDLADKCSVSQYKLLMSDVEKVKEDVDKLSRVAPKQEENSIKHHELYKLKMEMDRLRCDQDKLLALQSQAPPPPLSPPPQSTNNANQAMAVDQAEWMMQQVREMMQQSKREHDKERAEMLDTIHELRTSQERTIQELTSLRTNSDQAITQLKQENEDLRADIKDIKALCKSIIGACDDMHDDFFSHLDNAARVTRSIRRTVETMDIREYVWRVPLSDLHGNNDNDMDLIITSEPFLHKGFKWTCNLIRPAQSPSECIKVALNSMYKFKQKEGLQTSWKMFLAHREHIENDIEVKFEHEFHKEDRSYEAEMSNQDNRITFEEINDEDGGYVHDDQCVHLTCIVTDAQLLE